MTLNTGNEPGPGDDNRRVDDLFAEAYSQLRRMAHAQLDGQRPGHTLQPTALVNEAFLKLRHHFGTQPLERDRFVRVAAEAIRQILIDHARHRNRAKRGGGKLRVDLECVQLATGQLPEEFLALNEAICRFESIEPRGAEIVKLRFFTGLSVEETAAVTGLSVRTIHREWRFARAWLLKELE